MPHGSALYVGVRETAECPDRGAGALERLAGEEQISLRKLVLSSTT
jgi:hypothetical protein